MWNRRDSRRSHSIWRSASRRLWCSANASSAPAPSAHANPHTAEAVLATVQGPWALSFPPNWGAPASVQLSQLVSWTESNVPGVKYFSGTATYSKQLAAPRAWFQSGRRIVLDLGTVRDIAEVEVNGKPAGMVWAPPYRVDVTSELKPGANQLTIEVTDEWTNRIVGDRLLPSSKRVLPESGAAPPRGGVLRAARAGGIGVDWKCHIDRGPCALVSSQTRLDFALTTDIPIPPGMSQN